MAYVLVRTTPEGVEKTGLPLPTKRAAAVSAGRVLNDNARVPKEEAQRFSAALAKMKLGETSAHASGHHFRIERAF